LSPVCSTEVSVSLAAGHAVVAPESTIFSDLGLPSPANAEALDRCVAEIRGAGPCPS
jgi:pseudouridine-5'-phosphate glycosidase